MARRRHGLAMVSCVILLVCSLSLVTAASTITHLVDATAGDPGRGGPKLEILQTLADEFKAETGIEVELIAGGFGEVRSKIPILAATDTLADVVDIVSQFTFDYGGFLEDLTPHIERDNVDLSVLVPVLLEPFKAQVDGREALIGMPLFFYSHNMGINLRSFNEAGLATPAEMGDRDWNWATLREYAQKLTLDGDGDGRPNQYGLQFRTWIHRLSLWFRHAGAPLWDRQYDPTEVTTNTPGAIDTLTFLHDMTSQGWVTNSTDPWFGGQAAMSFADAWPQMHTFVEFDADFVRFPYGPAGLRGTEFQAEGFGVNKASTNKEAAWEWVKFMALRTENVERLTITFGLPPALREAIAAYREDGLPSQHIVFENMFEPDTTFRPMSRETSIFTTIEREFVQALRGNVSPQQAAVRAQETAGAALRQAWLR